MNAPAATSHIAVTLAALLPTIGSEWKEEGGIYAGIARGQNGAADYHLVVGPEAEGELKWKPAMEFAKAIDVNGRADFDLPARHEQALLFGNVPELFRKDWYWSNTPHAESARGAWCQDFGYGDQYYDAQNLKLRARAVRRVPLQ